MAISKIKFKHNTEAVSKKQYDDHLELYGGYINKTNEIDSILKSSPDYKSANATYSKFRELKKEQTYALNGVILHEEYFKNMGHSRQRPGEKTLGLMDRFFGGYDKWKEDFIACAISARGWCITSYSQRENAVSTFIQDTHDYGVITMAYPLIVLDMYEHAYFLDYGIDKLSYARKFVECINWSLVELKAEKIIKNIYSQK